MKITYDYKNEDDFKIFVSTYNFYWANELTIDFRRMSINPEFMHKIPSCVRSLKVKIILAQYENFIGWIRKLPLLDKLELEIDNDGSSVPDVRFEENLSELKLSGSVCFSVESDSLKKLDIDSISYLDLSKIPNVIDFRCECVTDSIVCANKRYFRNFDVKFYMDFIGMENVFVSTKLGYVGICGAKNLSRIFRGRINKIDKNFYLENPIVQEIILWNDEFPPVEVCDENLNIKKISSRCFPNDEFENLEEFVYLRSSGISSDLNQDDVFKVFVAKKHNYKITVEFSGDVVGELYDYIPDEYNITFSGPKRFFTNKPEKICPFLDRRPDIDFFTIKTLSCTLPQEWLQKYNYIKRMNTYYLTRKPHPGVIIFKQGTIELDDFTEKNCDHVEIIGPLDLRVENFNLKTLFISNCILSDDFIDNEIENITVENTRVQKVFEISSSMKKVKMIDCENFHIILSTDHIEEMYLDRCNFFFSPLSDSDVTVKNIVFKNCGFSKENLGSYFKNKECIQIV
jgi:hypothetical protein